MSKSSVIIYSKAHCPYCDYAKAFFDSHQIAYKEMRIDQDAQALKAMQQITQARTVPQIVINNRLIGGYTDLMSKYESEGLQELMSE